MERAVRCDPSTLFHQPNTSSYSQVTLKPGYDDAVKTFADKSGLVKSPPKVRSPKVVKSHGACAVVAPYAYLCFFAAAHCHHPHATLVATRLGSIKT